MHDRGTQPTHRRAPPTAAPCQGRRCRFKSVSSIQNGEPGNDPGDTEQRVGEDTDTVRKPYPSLGAARTLVENLRADFPDLVRVNLDAYVERSFVRALDESGYIDGLSK